MRPCNGSRIRHTDDQAAAIHAWVLAVLEAEIGAFPIPLPAGVVGVAIELGAVAVPAPGGVTSTTFGGYSATYTTRTPSEPRTRTQRRRLRHAIGHGRAFSINPTTR